MPFDASDGEGGGCDKAHIIAMVSEVPLCSYETLAGFNYPCPSCGEELVLRHPVQAQFYDYDSKPRALFLCRTEEEAYLLAKQHQKNCELGFGKISTISEEFPHATVQGWGVDTESEDEICSTGWIVVTEHRSRLFASDEGIE